MTGIEKAFIEEVKEGMSFKEAILEFIDNGFEHAKSRVDVVFDKRGNSIRFSNDGVAIQHLSDIVSDFTTHIEQDSIRGCNKPISCFGKGFKKAFLKLGDMSVGSTISIYGKDEEYGVTQYASIKSVYKEENCISHVGADIWRGKDVIDYNRGTMMSITNVEPSFWAVCKYIEDYCSDRYGLVSKVKKIDLYINGKKVIFNDYCRLENLGNNIDKDGVYVINGIVYWVHTYCPVHPKYGQVSFKCVYTFITREAEKGKTEDGRGGLNDSGYYTYRGNRMMDCGGNAQKMFGSNGKKLPAQFNTGGCERFRIAVFTDNALEFFGIRSNKSLGVLPFSENELMSEYKLNGVNIYNVLRQDAISFGSLNTDESKAYKKTGKYNHLTSDMIKRRCRTYKERIVCGDVMRKSTKSMPIVNQSQITVNDGNINIDELLKDKPSDNISMMIDNNQMLTQREKSMLWSVVVGIQRNKGIETIIGNAIKKIEDYELNHTETSVA